MKKLIIRTLILICGSLLFSSLVGEEEPATNERKLIYVFEIRDQIAKPVLRTVQKCFIEIDSLKPDYILIHLNTYGGRVDIADSIRTKLINSKIPIMVFIDNQAISAGALISIAGDSIYMRPGGSIGAATVVDQSGQQVPDKYQSFMRSTMRATAESHGKDTIIEGTDTIIKWHRNPKIAEAMVDPNIKVAGVSDSGQVLTLTATEAIEAGYCEGLANNINEVIKIAGIVNYEIKYYTPSTMDKIIGFLLNPVLQGILIMLILGGIYFELQTPGVGFPLALAVAAALMYFAPLYLNELAQSWELIVFVVGVILIALEIFAIPGFGVAGISGIVLVVLGLTMSLVDNVQFEYHGFGAVNLVLKALGRVLLSLVLAFILSIYISKKLFTSKTFKLALNDVMNASNGYIGIDSNQKTLIGKEGIANTVLRPSGKIEIEGEIYDAIAEIGFIEKGTKVKVMRDEAGQLYVLKV